MNSDSDRINDGERHDLAEYADSKAEELCKKIALKTGGLYDAVLFIDESSPPDPKATSLFIHRSVPTTLDNAVAISLYFVDKGDLAYEPRLQEVESVLRSMPEIVKISRTTAPDSMVKDMLIATMILRDRRRADRSTVVDRRHAQ